MRLERQCPDHAAYFSVRVSTVENNDTTAPFHLTTARHDRRKKATAPECTYVYRYGNAAMDPLNEMQRVSSRAIIFL